MCGISGVIAKDYIDKDSFLKMNQIIRHRGPDDEGFVLFNDTSVEVLGTTDTESDSWLSNELYSPKYHVTSSTLKAKIGFAHRRLSILDLSPKGHQPMCSNDERYWITFNGEVYNYLEIRDELIELGYVFNSDTDTEVILVAYQEWGIECQHKFNGMWAFAIFDRHEKTIFISRDRFGIKPLYFWYSPNGDFYFASEIKQFTVLPCWSAYLNKDRAFDYLYYSLTDHTKETLFKDVYNLQASHYIFDKYENILNASNNLKLIKWYTIKLDNSNFSFPEAKNIFLDKFKDSVKLHLRADVPVGSALSGGLDSSSIVSYINILLRQENKSELQKTFSSCSEDSRYDERSWMEEVVREIEVDGHYVYPKGEDIFNLTDKLIWYMDEPYQSQSAFLGYHVFKEARNNNVIVLLNGQGADEYLSGYSSYRTLRHKGLVKKMHFNQLYFELGSFKEIFRIILHTIFDSLPNRFRYKFSFYNKQYRLFNRIINSSVLKSKKIHPYKKLRYNNQSHSNISLHQLFKEPLQKYLRWEDRNSMAHSVEARVPFLDYRLIEFVLSLPLDYLDEPNKSKKILVEALKGILPEKVRNRKDKKGFITPEERWFKVDYFHDFIKLFKENVKFSKGIINERDAVQFFNEVKSGEIDFSYDYWRIILFCVWMKTFNVEID